MLWVTWSSTAPPHAERVWCPVCAGNIETPAQTRIRARGWQNMNADVPALAHGHQVFELVSHDGGRTDQPVQQRLVQDRDQVRRAWTVKDRLPL